MSSAAGARCARASSCTVSAIRSNRFTLCALAPFKTAGLMEDGRVQVTGFYLPGELLGIDAISTDRHPCSAEALETSEVCEIPL